MKGREEITQSNYNHTLFFFLGAKSPLWIASFCWSEGRNRCVEGIEQLSTQANATQLNCVKSDNEHWSEPTNPPHPTVKI